MIHSVRLDVERCKGCTTCIRSCPTDAIRVRRGKAAILAARCIDCGQCVKVCPHKAIRAVTDPFDLMQQFTYTVALPEPALYGQFHHMDDVNIILNGLKTIGFDQVWEVGRAGELLSDYADEVRKNGGLHRPKIRPVISSACPAVVRLIRMRFPKLIPNIGTVVMPAELAAKLARREAEQATGLPPEQIGVFLITPCPSKATTVHSPEALNEPVIDGVFSINDIYLRLLNPMRELEELEPLCTIGKRGVSWAFSGGESRARGDESYLAVDGIEHVIQMLEDIEDGRLPEADFIELSACTKGCVGGCLNVENPFAAKMRIQQVMKNLPERAEALPKTERDLLHFERELEYSPVFVLDEDRGAAMEKLFKIDQLLQQLPGLDCASCGAPSCRALAEDVVLGRASEDDCIFRMGAKMAQLAGEDSDAYLPPPFRRRKAEPKQKKEEPS